MAVSQYFFDYYKPEITNYFMFIKRFIFADDVDLAVFYQFFHHASKQIAYPLFNSKTKFKVDPDQFIRDEEINVVVPRVYGSSTTSTWISQYTSARLGCF